MSIRDTRARLVAAVAVGAVVAAAAGWTMLVAPERDTAEALHADVELKHGDLARRLQELEQPTVAAALPASDVAQLATALPDRTDISTVLGDLDRLARTNGLGFRSVTPSHESVGSGSRVLPLTLAVEGRFDDVSRFLRDLRSTVEVRDGRLRARGQVYSVTGLVLGAPEGASLPLVEATVTVNAHAFAPTPPPAAESPTPVPGTTETVAAGADS